MDGRDGPSRKRYSDPCFGNSRNHTYVYEASSNRLTQIKQTVGGAVVANLGYDVRGNLASKGAQTYQFDNGNRLRNVPGKETGYQYDALGRRVYSSTTGSSYIVSLYSQAGVLLYQQDYKQAKRLEYVYLGGSLVAFRETPHGTSTNVVKYQHTDALGTPIAVTDAAKAIIETSEYEPYGQLVNSTLKDGPGFTGHVQDAATGLTYMQQRYYDPTVGRFLSIDPVSVRISGDNFNRYSYAFNNPYKFVDPDGRDNQLGIIVRFAEAFARGENPTAQDTKVLNAAQRSVDLTVNAVMNGSDESRKEDAKVWNVTADPDYVNGKAAADTTAYPASGDDPKLIDTVYTAKIAEAAEIGSTIKTSDGLTSEGGDPALLAIGAHELGHGSDGNMKITNEKESEKDVGERVKDTIKTSPDVDRGKIR